MISRVAFDGWYLFVCFLLGAVAPHVVVIDCAGASHAEECERVAVDYCHCVDTIGAVGYNRTIEEALCLKPFVVRVVGGYNEYFGIVADASVLCLHVAAHGVLSFTFEAFDGRIE